MRNFKNQNHLEKQYF